MYVDYVPRRAALVALLFGILMVATASPAAAAGPTFHADERQDIVVSTETLAALEQDLGLTTEQSHQPIQELGVNRGAPIITLFHCEPVGGNGVCFLGYISDYPVEIRWHSNGAHLPAYDDHSSAVVGCGGAFYSYNVRVIVTNQYGSVSRNEGGRCQFGDPL